MRSLHALSTDSRGFRGMSGATAGVQEVSPTVNRKFAGQVDPPSVYFVAHFAYGAMTGRRDGHIGGVERRTSLMARWLTEQGYSMSMLTCDEGQPDGVEIEGVRVFKMCRREAGLLMLRAMKDLSIAVERWEWNREQAQRLVDVAFHALRRGDIASGVAFLGRALLCCPSTVTCEPPIRAIRRLFGWARRP